MSSRGFLGAGDLYARVYNPVTGQFDQWSGPFESSKFEIKPNSDLKEMTSRGRSTYGQVIESVPLPKPAFPPSMAGLLPINLPQPTVLV